MHLRFMHYPAYKLYSSKVLLLLRVEKKIDGYRKHDLQTKWYRARFLALEIVRDGGSGKELVGGWEQVGLH